MRVSADERRRFGVDEGLHHRGEQPAHQLTVIGAAHHLEQLEQGRLVQGHRVDLLLRVPWRVLPEPDAVAPQRP
jgi:hypothetical protein